MCRFTLSEDGWGVYDTGVVASSGYGDGVYPMTVAKNEEGKVVSIAITFIGEDDEEDEWDDEDEEFEE
jgi:hypothetical protein